MKKFFLTFLLFASAVMLPGAVTEPQLLQAVSKIYMAIPPEAGHQVPAQEFIRRIDRVVRQLGRFDNASGSTELVLHLQSAQTPGSWQFRTAAGNSELILPVDYRRWQEYPELGRALISAILRCRMGDKPQNPLPEDALWIADGLWAEFVQRERSGQQILRFTYLPGLRNLAENNLDVTPDPQNLLPPLAVRLFSGSWQLYSERARLMLEIVHDITPRQSNLLKDYIFLLQTGKLSAKECFEKSFFASANDNLRRSGNYNLQKRAPGAALKTLALRKLFSLYAPMSPAPLMTRFDAVDNVRYSRVENAPAEFTASLTDLPQLVTKYPSCGELPLEKIGELNELAALMPSQLRGDIFRLTAVLASIGSEPDGRVSSEISRLNQQIRSKLKQLQTVDMILAEFEHSSLPLLYDQRFKLASPLPEPALPPLIRKFFESSTPQ